MAKFLRAAEVARVLGVSGSAVRRWIADGYLPSITTPGGHYLVDPDVLEEWLAQLAREKAARLTGRQAKPETEVAA